MHFVGCLLDDIDIFYSGSAGTYEFNLVYICPAYCIYSGFYRPICVQGGFRLEDAVFNQGETFFYHFILFGIT